jgi:hypothetical protein
MKFSLCAARVKRSVWRSVPYLGYLPLVLILFGLLSGCSTRVDTENGGAQVLPQNQVPPPVSAPPAGGNYSPTYDPNNPYLPINDPNNPSYPSYPGNPTYPSAGSLNCYIQRSGGYYYVNYPVRWDFYAENGEPLEIVRIESGENWSTPPQYPLPSSFSIYFHSPGQRQLSFVARSSRNRSLYCNGGSPLYDSIYVNSSGGYSYYY